jgi:hypothetical protein
VTATGASAIQESAVQPPAIGFGFPRLVPERPDSELLAPAPVTCHLKRFFIRQLLAVSTFELCTK